MGFFKRNAEIETATTSKEEKGKMTSNTQKNENGIFELVFILDRSGSMAGLENDTIGGFNSLIEKQKKEDGKCYVTTVLFDHLSETVHDRVELSEISPMTREQYFVRGSTALLDAVGETIEHISYIHKYIRAEDVPCKTLFVITTDGMENASRKYNADKVKKLITDKKNHSGWEFLFLGANIDAISVASNIGIPEDRAARFNNDSVGTVKNYEAVSNFACTMRSAVPCSANLDASWKTSIEEDYKKRGKR